MKRIVLASASPRRKELLEQIGIEFEIAVSKGEEKYKSTVPEEIVKELALGKAENVAADLVEHLPVAVGHLLGNLLLESGNVQFQRAAEHGDDSRHGHEQSDDDNQYCHRRLFQRLFV